MAAPPLSAKLLGNLPSPAKPNADSDKDEDEPLLCSLGFKQRMICFAVCWALSFLVSIVSFSAIAMILTGRHVRWGILYTLGNLLNIASTLFLVGPKRQLKAMFDDTRKYATIIYLLSIVATIVAVFTVKILLVILVAVIIQWLALCWYSLSYIPFGRQIARRVVASI